VGRFRHFRSTANGLMLVLDSEALSAMARGLPHGATVFGRS
jgi:hypothetical protein